MPTRVVLDESPSAIQREPSSNTLQQREQQQQQQHDAPFRSSLMRSVVDPSSSSRNVVYTSATDIRASPRLTGYLYILIASVVMMASVAQFYRNDDLYKAFFDDYGYLKTEKFVLISGTRVFQWKFIGAFIVACLGTSTSLFIVLVHFDTFFYPRFWRKVFRDGSVWERNLLIVNGIFWVAGVHVCTSSFSIGATQANVYFTTWIAFVASIVNYDMWRASADLPNFSEFVARRRKTTTYNWFYAFIFCIVTASSVTDMYLNRDYFVFYDSNGTPVVPVTSDWIRAVVITWTAVVTSALVMAAKIKWDNWQKVYSYCEGLLIATFIGVAAWVCTTFTGVQGPIRGPSNAYFGLWGIFFSSLATFGTWLRETGGAQKLRQFSLSVATGHSMGRLQRGSAP